MVDGSFNSLIVLKTINLFKSLIKFHLGALEFTYVICFSEELIKIFFCILKKISNSL